MVWACHFGVGGESDFFWANFVYQSRSRAPDRDRPLGLGAHCADVSGEWNFCDRIGRLCRSLDFGLVPSAVLADRLCFFEHLRRSRRLFFYDDSEISIASHRDPRTVDFCCATEAKRLVTNDRACQAGGDHWSR